MEAISHVHERSRDGRQLLRKTLALRRETLRVPEMDHDQNSQWIPVAKQVTPGSAKVVVGKVALLRKEGLSRKERVTILVLGHSHGRDVHHRERHLHALRAGGALADYALQHMRGTL